MSLRAVQRLLLTASAALTLSGSLALAVNASATQLPWGTPADTSATSIYGLLNSSYVALEGADYVLNNKTDTAVPCTPSGSPPTCTGFPAENALKTTQAQQIAADFTGQTINGTAPNAHSPAWSAEAQSADVNYSTDAPKVAAAGASWSQLSGLVSQLYHFGGSLYSIDNDLAVTSSATVTAKRTPTAYSIRVGVTAGTGNGYVLPSAFTLTFPATFGVNVALAYKELPASDEASPPIAQAIGTVTVNTPVAPELGGSGSTVTGTVYAVNANGSIAQPDIELWFRQNIYLLGRFPTTPTFPLTVTFGEVNIAGTIEPMPFRSLTISFPTKTSPVEALSCSNLGRVTGTATDALAAIATQFGDTSDGYSPAGNTPVAVASPPTSVTDLCAPTGAIRLSGIKRVSPTVAVTIRGNGGTPFTSATIIFPKGISANRLKARDLKVTGAKLKSVKGGTKVTVTFRAKTRTATIKFLNGLTITTHKTKSLTVRFTVRYTPPGVRATTSAAGSVTVRHLP